MVLLAACNQVYDLEPTEVIGAKQCANVRFGPPLEVPGFGDFGDYHPQLGPDQLEMWFMRNEGSAHVLYRSTRPDVNSPFGSRVKASLVAGASEVDPTMMGDGTRLMVIDYDNGMRVYEGVRADATSPMFPSVRGVVGLDDTPGFSGVDAIDLSWSGLAIYYTGKINGELWVASRESLDAPFTSRRLLFDGIEHPSVSPDELEVFYTHIGEGNTGPIYRRGRAGKEDAFGDEEVVVSGAFDPDVSPNAEDLVVSAKGVLSVLTRECR